MKIYIMLFGLSLLLFFTHLYVYSKGLYNGEWNYKRSKHMALALESSYRYGMQDGKDTCNESTKRENLYITCPAGVYFIFFTANNRGIIDGLHLEGPESGQCTIEKGIAK